MAHQRRPAAVRPAAAALLVWGALWGVCQGQMPPLHFQHPVGIPPGVVGIQRLGRGGPVAGVFQPVEIIAPQGAWVALAEAGTWAQPQKAPLHVGLLVGHVYRICVLNIPGQVGQEVFPTIEVIDRLYAPAGQETRFPIQIELTAEDLRLALEGKYVTRVIYLEDPEQALPAPADGAGQAWFDVPPGRDPLVVADALGRPVAIVRLGGRVPEQAERLDPQFLFGCPPVWRYEPPPGAGQDLPRVTVLPRPPRPGRAKPVAMEVSSR